MKISVEQGAVIVNQVRQILGTEHEHDDWVPTVEVSRYTAYVYLYREGGPGCGEMLYERRGEP